MDWLSVGNGWRNLYLLSCVLQAAALGLLFAAHRIPFQKSRAASFCTGVAAVPFLQYLWVLALAFLWPNAPRLVYIGVLPALSAICLLVMLLRRMRRVPALLKRGGAFVRRLCHFEKPALAVLCFALCLLILLLPACVRFCSSMQSVSGGDAGEYMALGLRFCEDRDIGKLLEKNETEGHFRGHSHFPSLELFMSYGLFHTGGELGYPNDKAAFAGIGMLTFYMAAAYLALLLFLCRERKAWVLLGMVLLNLVPELYYSVAGAPRDIWRILALFLAALAFAGIEPCGHWKAYLGKLAIAFAVCFTVMSAHVVCFVVLPFIVAAWVLWRWLEALLYRNKSAGRTLAASVGIALSGAAGTVVAFLGNLWCFAKWGEMSPWRLMTTYTSAPWYPMYMDMEYKLEETTTHLEFFAAKDSIFMSYATPIGLWGWRLALTALLCAVGWMLWRRCWMRKRERELRTGMPGDGPCAVFFTQNEATPMFSAVLYAALLTLCTLAPMTGLLDSPLYSFSGSFLKLQRYTLQWFMFGAVMICAALAALDTLWPTVLSWVGERFHSKRKKAAAQVSAAVRLHQRLLPMVRRLPAYLCVLLCVLGFVQGTKQQGYANSFYRHSRHVMEDESILLDNDFRDRYALLMQVAAHVPENEKILITRVGYQYALRGRGYVLTANPIVPLMNLPKEELGAALASMQVAMLATEPGFWDDRYYALSTLDEYVNELPKEQIIETEKMRLYLLDPALVPYAQEAAAHVREKGKGN
ncbi:MAG: hypothetical protein RR865_03015 [Clostridia bacterium]